MATTGEIAQKSFDATLEAQKQTLASSLQGEWFTKNRLMTAPLYNNTRCTADTAIQPGGVGVVHSIIVSQPASATPTAGVFTLYDNTAESGTVIFSHYFPASAVPVPVPIPINCPYTVGLYASFDATLAGLVFNVEWL